MGTSLTDRPAPPTLSLCLGIARTLDSTPRTASRWSRRLHALQSPFDRTPFLGALASIAALGDLAVNRVLVRVLTGEHSTLITWSRTGDLVRNLAAVTGLVALTAALIRFAMDSGLIRLWRRLIISALAGVFLPVVSIALFVPAEGSFQLIGPVAAISALILTIQIALAGARTPAPVGVRLGTLLIALTAFSGFVNLLTLIALPKLGGTVLGSLLVRGLVGAGETAYLVTPVVVGVTLWARPGLTRRTRIFAAAATLASFAMIAAGKVALDRTFKVVLVGAQDVTAFLDTSPGLYLLAFPVAFGVVALGLAHRHPASRQVAWAMLLLLCAGFTPRTPSRALMLVLGAALLTRSTIALAIYRRARASTGAKRSRSTTSSSPLSSETV